MERTVLVVGATGNFGNPVARQLLADGFQVRLLARDPDQARQRFGELFHVVRGDVTQPETLRKALRGCYGVHINLAGGFDDATVDAIEHRGTANVARAAAEQGVQRLTYLSGATVCEANAAFANTRAKLNAERAIAASGVPYSIFRATSFMEGILQFKRGGDFGFIGAQPIPRAFVAARDYARMVSQALIKPEAANKTFYVFGPEALTVRQALERFCAIAYPQAKIQTLPFWLAQAIAALTFSAPMKAGVAFLRYYETAQEPGDATEANTLLGAPTTTIEQYARRWAQLQSDARSAR